MDLQHAVLRWGRRIAFPFGGTPPPARQLSACPVVIVLAGHPSRASLEFLEVFGLDAKRPQCLLEPLGVIFEALEPS